MEDSSYLDVTNSSYKNMVSEFENDDFDDNRNIPDSRPNDISNNMYKQLGATPHQDATPKQEKGYPDAITKIFSTFESTYANMLSLLQDKEQEVQSITRQWDIAELEVQKLRTRL